MTKCIFSYGSLRSRFITLFAIALGGCIQTHEPPAPNQSMALPVVAIEPTDAEPWDELTEWADDGGEVITENNTPFRFLFRRNNKRYVASSEHQLMLLDEAPLPDSCFTFSYTLHEGVTRQAEFDAIVLAFESYFSVKIGVEPRLADSYSLISIQDDHPSLQPSTPSSKNFAWGVDRLLFEKTSMGELAARFQNKFGVPCVDKTGLTGYFDFRLEVAHADSGDPEKVNAALHPLGLALEHTRQPLEFLVISSRTRDKGK